MRYRERKKASSII